jgi:hypothetical protein
VQIQIHCPPLPLLKCNQSLSVCYHAFLFALVLHGRCFNIFCEPLLPATISWLVTEEEEEEEEDEDEEDDDDDNDDEIVLRFSKAAVAAAANVVCVCRLMFF